MRTGITRRGLVAALAAGTGLLAGCTALPQAAPTPSPSTSVSASDYPVPALGQVEAGQPVPTDAVFDPTAVDWADARHGHAVVRRCAASCEDWVATTADGGETWTGAPLGTSDPSTEFRVYALSGDEAVLTPFPGQVRWGTSDAGARWSSTTARPLGTVDEIPAGALAEVRANAIEVTRPDGSVRTLSSFPPVRFTEPDHLVAEAVDGSRWVLGDSSIFVSRDRGRTWVEVPLPARANVPVTGLGSDVQLLLGDGVAYLVDRHLYDAWRTADDGTHWQRLELPWGPGMEPSILLATANAAGAITVFDSRYPEIYRASVTATSFTRVTAGDVAGRVVRPDYTATGELTGYSTSADGVTWTPVPFAVAA